MQNDSPCDRHLFGPGPKRIVALDGGGVNGAMTIAFLKANISQPALLSAPVLCRPAQDDVLAAREGAVQHPVAADRHDEPARQPSTSLTPGG